MLPNFEQAVREALADVNYDMVPVLAKLSPEQRFAMIGQTFARHHGDAGEYEALEQSAGSELPRPVGKPIASY